MESLRRKQDKAAYVTTFIDYYGIDAHYQFPDWTLAHQNQAKNRRMTILEAAMHQSVNNSLHNRFIPYLQLHEFEGLLFNNIEAYTNQIPEGEFVNKDELIKTIEDNPNPELINDTPDNAPSYRLKRLIKGYSKIVYGAILAREIGLERIRAKCPRFDSWIIRLESL